MNKILTDDNIRQSVRNTYGEIAGESESTCGCSTTCCTESETLSEQDFASKIGYSNQEIESVPEGANLGLGCGNPQAIASLKPGETVLDLGSGAGFDCFLAARQVGETGIVLGVDMTPQMISKARANAETAGLDRVEFRLGEIEAIPVADASVDVILSNCVINLSPDKPRVFNEAFRVLKPGGRLAISDMVATSPLPDELRNDLALYSGCAAGAALIEELKAMLEVAGFENIRIQPKDEVKEIMVERLPGENIDNYINSATIEAVKPL